ncbi:hypothetical protein HDV00_008714 [Rhizophlyctis rosea]|nr:hypothetical protein HDV00_008714 [Rhizophlyctis rosea]
MKLITALTVRVIVPLVIGCLALGLTSAILLYTTAPAWTDKIRQVINPKEFNAFAIRALTKGAYVQEVLSAFQTQTTLITTFTRDLLRRDVTGQVPFDLSRPYPKYFAAQLLDASGNAVDPPLPANQNLVSQFYQNNVTTLAQFNALGTDNFTTLDDPFRAIYWNKATPQSPFQALQIGFENTEWRQYPYQYNLAKTNPRNQLVCNETWAPQQYKDAQGYIPNCRIWYTQALAAANANSSTLSTGLGPLVITSPYRSTTTGKIHITVAQAFASSSSVAGVFSIAVRVDTLRDALMRSAMVEGGYVFMIKDDGTVILYPEDRLNGVDIYARPTSVGLLEFGGDQNKLNDFLGQVKGLVQARGSGSGYVTMQKNGQEWAMSAAAINGTNLYVVVTAPTSAINALSNSLLGRVQKAMIISLSIQIILLILLTTLAYIYIRRSTQRILTPIHDLILVLSRLKDNDLSVEVGGRRPSVNSVDLESRGVARDIDAIQKSIRGLVIAIRFGNEAYYGGDLQKALRNYEAAERLMRDMNNERGLGVCLNNKGNVYKQMQGHFVDSKTNYEAAIDNAKVLAERELDMEKKRGFEIARANRVANLGALYKDQKPLTDVNAAEAERLLKEAMALHRAIDNMDGMAQAASNLGQLYIERNRIHEAEELIQDAYDFVKAKGKDVPLQYVCMSRGMLAEANNKPADAIAWYTYVLQKHKTIVRNIQRYAVERIIYLCALPEINRPNLAKTISEVAAPIFGTRVVDAAGKGKDKDGGVRSFTVSLSNMVARHLSLVLDVSGSMSGSFIRTCRTCLTTILSEYVQDGDSVSLLVFDNYTREIFPPTVKDHLTLPKMLKDIKTAQNNWGGTAFWDALLQTLETVKRSSSKVTDGKAKWIIALTDGGDNASQRGAYQKILKEVKDSGITLAVITVGPVPNAEEIKVACAASQGGGLFVSADASSEGIKEAFGKVVSAMTGWENVEFLD